MSYCKATNSFPAEPYALCADGLKCRLERCCLSHARTPSGSDEPSGHALTVQAPLLMGAPQTLDDRATWEVPASALDRLFELSSALNLDGELTPVQAWIRIQEHPLFHKFDPERLRQLCWALMKETQCFGWVILPSTNFYNMSCPTLSPIQHGPPITI